MRLIFFALSLFTCDSWTETKSPRKSGQPIFSNAAPNSTLGEHVNRIDVMKPFRRVLAFDAQAIDESSRDQSRENPKASVALNHDGVGDTSTQDSGTTQKENNSRPSEVGDTQTNAFSDANDSTDKHSTENHSTTVSAEDRKHHDKIMDQFRQNLDLLSESRYAFVARGIEIRRLTNRLATIWIGAQDFRHSQLKCYSVRSPNLNFDRQLIHDRERIFYQSFPGNPRAFDSVQQFHDSIRHQVAFFPVIGSLEGLEIQYSPRVDAGRLRQWSSDGLVACEEMANGDWKAVLEIDLELPLAKDQRQAATFRREALFAKSAGLHPVDVKNSLLIDGQTLQMSHVLTEWKRHGAMRLPTRMSLSKNPQSRKGASQWQIDLEWRIGEQLPLVFLVDRGLRDWREAVRLSFDEDWERRQDTPFFPGYFLCTLHADGTFDADDFCYGDRLHAEGYRDRLQQIFPNARVLLHYANTLEQRDTQRIEFKTKSTNE